MSSRARLTAPSDGSTRYSGSSTLTKRTPPSLRSSPRLATTVAHRPANGSTPDGSGSPSPHVPASTPRTSPSWCAPPRDPNPRRPNSVDRAFRESTLTIRSYAAIASVASASSVPATIHSSRRAHSVVSDTWCSTAARHSSEHEDRVVDGDGRELVVSRFGSDTFEVPARLEVPLREVRAQHRSPFAVGDLGGDQLLACAPEHEGELAGCGAKIADPLS